MTRVFLQIRVIPGASSWSSLSLLLLIAPVAPVGAAAVTGVCDDLLKLFGSVSDGRSGQGRDHPVAAVLALAAGGSRGGDEGLYGDRRLVRAENLVHVTPPGDIR